MSISDKDNAASSHVATLVRDPDAREIPFGELKWSADEAVEHTPKDAVELNELMVMEQQRTVVEPVAADQAVEGNRLWATVSFVFLFVVSFIIGYVLIGKQPVHEVFQLHTWIHIFQLLFG